MARCDATTITGGQCRNDAIPTSTRCYMHADPEERAVAGLRVLRRCERWIDPRHRCGRPAAVEEALCSAHLPTSQPQQPTLFDQDAVDLRHPALGLYLVKS
jgi:hypothetical protein